MSVKILHQNDYREEEAPGYGIWLILLGINLLTGFYHSAKAILFESEMLSVMTLSYYAITVIFTTVGLFNFWKRKRITPWLIIGFLTINLCYTLFHHYSRLVIEGEGYHFHLFRSAFFCLVAIPYLVLSGHVKKVFVN